MPVLNTRAKVLVHCNGGWVNTQTHWESWPALVLLKQNSLFYQGLVIDLDPVLMAEGTSSDVQCCGDAAVKVEILQKKEKRHLFIL